MTQGHPLRDINDYTLLLNGLSTLKVNDLGLLDFLSFVSFL